MRRLALALVLGGCTVVPATTTTTSTTTTQPASTTTSATTAGTVALPPCQAGTQEFVESGGAGVIQRDDTDSGVVSAVRWTRYDGCDRVVIDFATTSGAPAVTPPGVGPLFMRSSGVLRLELGTSVEASAVLDQAIDGTLARHAYVVRRTDGEMFIDVHFSSPAAIRVSAVSSPARIVVDAVLQGAPYPSPPFVGDDLVVIDPVGGHVVYPFTVNGYGLGDGEVTVGIAADGQTEERTGQIGGGQDAWGAFTVLVSDGPTGAATMTVDGQEFLVDLG